MIKSGEFFINTISIYIRVVELYAQQLRKMSVNDLKNRLQRKDKPLMVMDARDVTSYYKGHIPGACSLFDGEIMSLAKDLDKNLDICVYGPGQAQPSPSEIDRLAGDAVNKLQSLGFKNICVLDGGFEAWANAGNRVDASTVKSIKPA